MLKKIFSLFWFISLSLHASQELEVRLATKSTLPLVYVSMLHGKTAQSRYLEELREAFLFDLKASGFCKPTLSNEDSDAKIDWTDPRSHVDCAYWRRLQIPFVIALESVNEEFIVTVIQVEKALSKRYPPIRLSQKKETDCRSIHRLYDTLQKDLFGIQGIASCHILYSERISDSSNEWHSDIWIADYNGAYSRKLTMSKGYCLCPGFISFDSSAYYFVATDRSQSKILKGSLAHPETQVWITLRGSQMLPSLSSDGSQLAFISDAAGRPDLFIQTLDRSGSAIGKPRQIFSASNATQASPTFSPDGKIIAFVSDKSGSPRVYVLDTKETNQFSHPEPRLITRKNRENTSPAWSPDGKKIAYSARIEGSRQIWIYDWAADEEWQLTTGLENKENPSWAPDSLHLIYNTETKDISELYLININHPDPLQINLGFGQKRFAAWEMR